MRRRALSATRSATPLTVLTVPPNDPHARVSVSSSAQVWLPAPFDVALQAASRFERDAQRDVTNGKPMGLTPARECTFDCAVRDPKVQHQGVVRRGVALFREVALSARLAARRLPPPSSPLSQVRAQCGHFNVHKISPPPLYCVALDAASRFERDAQRDVDNGEVRRTSPRRLRVYIRPHGV